MSGESPIRSRAEDRPDSVDVPCSQLTTDDW